MEAARPTGLGYGNTGGLSNENLVADLDRDSGHSSGSGGGTRVSRGSDDLGEIDEDPATELAMRESGRDLTRAGSKRLAEDAEVEVEQENAPPTPPTGPVTSPLQFQGIVRPPTRSLTHTPLPAPMAPAAAPPPPQLTAPRRCRPQVANSDVLSDNAKKGNTLKVLRTSNDSPVELSDGASRRRCQCTPRRSSPPPHACFSPAAFSSVCRYGSAEGGKEGVRSGLTVGRAWLLRLSATKETKRLGRNAVAGRDRGLD